MNALEVAVDSNNIGVSLLERAQYDDALEVFRSAADLMYVVTQEIKARNSETDVDESLLEDSPSSSKKIRETQKRIVNIAASLAAQKGRVVVPDETDCFLYDRGFLLSMPFCGSAIPCALHSATILANMALAYHLSVPQISNADSPALRNAMTLYGMAYSVASRVEQNEDSRRVIMATLNNMAQIHHECGMYEESRNILDSLQEFIHDQIKAEDCDFSPEKRVYLLNAMFVHKPQGAAAA